MRQKEVEKAYARYEEQHIIEEKVARASKTFTKKEEGKPLKKRLGKKSVKPPSPLKVQEEHEEIAKAVQMEELSS